MPMVTVNLYAAARASVGAASIQVGTQAQSGSLAAIVAAVCREHPDFAAVWPRCSFLIDGLAAHGDLATITVEPGSEIDVLPPFAGG